MVGDIVLDGRAVANRVDITQWRAYDTEVGVRLKCVTVVLAFKLLCYALGEFGLC